MTTFDAVLLVAHGTVDALDDLPELLKNIRRGHPAPPELLAEVRRRYEAIGGQSPLNSINRELAKRLEARLGKPVGFANRLFRPYPAEVLKELAGRGLRRILVLPLAQHSAGLYVEATKKAALDANLDLTIEGTGNWGQTPALIEAFARSVVKALGEVPAAMRDRTSVLFSAHSLPVSIIEAGDPYQTEFEKSVEAVVGRVRELLPGSFVDHAVVYQSQGMSTAGGRPIVWLGPDLKSGLQAFAAKGRKEVVVAPIGFLADHVEILYDLDIEARSWAEELGLVLRRAPSLDASDAMVEALMSVVAKTGGG
ncbi:MAG: ferrochelatase [Deltaproteobacteria bacterium]|nr:ferrochelatase [Deltaproteobacteria bacterium]